MTNAHNTVLYCGATTDLYKRIQEHKNKIFKNSFTLKYNVDKLVYFESFSIAGDAFEREKQIKAGSRRKKIELIVRLNPEWKDLSELLKANEGEELIRIKRLFKKQEIASPQQRLWTGSLCWGSQVIIVSFFFLYKENSRQSHW